MTMAITTTKEIDKMKTQNAGQLMRGSCSGQELNILEGKYEKKGAKERPRRIWTESIRDWTGIESYGELKRTDEDREKRRQLMTTNLRCEDGT